ncbi:MAG: GrpB family protein [Phycisphaerales bacterium]|nr:GrpB family protein [Phycisphaerales bacterium]
MPIVVVDYDSQWPKVYEQLRSQIWPAIEDIAETMEHVGSTSVPGLAAKPIIDVTIIAADPDRLGLVIQRLGANGYHHRGDLGVPGREVFSLPVGRPYCHLYAGVRSAVAIQNHLVLRDRLRANRDLAAAYGRLKKELALRFSNDIDGYIAGKTEFILSVLRDAGFASSDLEAIADVNTVAALRRPRDKNISTQN